MTDSVDFTEVLSTEELLELTETSVEVFEATGVVNSDFGRLWELVRLDLVSAVTAEVGTELLDIDCWAEEEIVALGRVVDSSTRLLYAAGADV
jgi:hypothetical protein